MSNDPPQLLRDRYELGAPLGSGAFGATHVARDHATGAEVVCKLVRVRGMPGWKPFELFEREVAVLRAVKHPGVPRFVDAFEAELAPGDPALVLVMERVPGVPLLALVERGHRWEEGEARALLTALLEILAHLHALSPPVIHRDLKPGNVIVRPDGTPALVDFGGVHDLGVRAGHGSLTVVGTAGYMPPEQAMGITTPASDLFALGATVVHALTHCHPADLPREGLRIAFEARVGCSPALRAVLRRLVEPDLRDRYARAEEALADLRRPPPLPGALAPREAPALPVPAAPIELALPPAPRPLSRGVAERIGTMALGKAALATAGGGGLGVPILFGVMALELPVGFAAAAVGVGVAGLAALGGLVYGEALNHLRALCREGPVVQGRIRLIARPSVRGERYADVHFDYEVDGTPYEGDLSQAGESADLIEVGDPVLVFYDRANPRVHVASVTLPEDVLEARRAVAPAT